MIDTHSHIYSEEFDDDRDLIISRAKEAEVSKNHTSERRQRFASKNA